MVSKIQKIGITLAVLLLTICTSAQQMEVNGVVYDEDNLPLPGVMVLEKGTTNGTQTDFDGKFTLKTSIGKTLVFSYLGHITQEVKVKKAEMKVVLVVDDVVLDEVVITGYRQENKKRAKVAYEAMEMSYMPISVDEDNEEYESFKENRFLRVEDKPLSTFSLDVDAASYANIRRMINKGQFPEKDAVRVEEMINYFSYDYPQPTGNDPVRITTEKTICPWNENHQLVRIGVKAREIPSENLPASNFVFLIDVSGSMSDANKLPLVKSSLKLLTNNLRAEDRVSIVVYAGAAGEVLPATNGDDKQKIMDAFDNLKAGGSTAGGAGIELAYKIAEKNFVKNGNNRVILCTDGDFNVGVSSTNALESLIEQKRKSGVFLTVLGYGMGNYKDNKLQTLAQKGNGNHAYIDNLQEANKVLVNEFGSTMYAVAKDVKIQVEFNPAFVNAYRLVGYETRLLNDEDFNDDTKDAGELGAGHTVTAIYEIVPAGVEIPTGKIDPLKYQPSKTAQKVKSYANTNELLMVKLRYKKPDENRSEKIEVPVLATNVVNKPSGDFNFAMAVAMFGQILRDSDFKGNANYAKVIELAHQGLNNDSNGYRREFVRLVQTTEQLSK